MKNPAWVVGFGIAVLTIVFSSGIYMINMQDYANAVQERNQAKMRVETYALDALDMYLDTEYRAEGVTVLIPGSELEVEAYVQQRIYEYDVLKSNIQNLSLDVDTINPGNSRGSKYAAAYQNQYSLSDYPYLKGTLRGEYKKVMRTATDKDDTIPFSTEIFVKLNFIDKDRGYINRVD